MPPRRRLQAGTTAHACGARPPMCGARPACHPPVMPSEAAQNAPFYAERLRVPLRWWFITAAGVGVGGTEIAAGFDWHVSLVAYLGLGIPAIALLLGMSSATVRVDTAGLHAGGRSLALDDVAAA